MTVPGAPPLIFLATLSRRCKPVPLLEPWSPALLPTEKAGSLRYLPSPLLALLGG